MKSRQTSKSRAALMVVAITALVISGFATLTSGSANAGAPGMWSKISTGEVSNINRPSLARSADGTLRALFVEKASGNTEDDLTLASVDSAGSLVSSAKVLTNYSQAEDPVLLINGSTFTAVTNGLGQRYPGDPHIGRMFEVKSSDNGATWVNQPYSLGKSTVAYASSGTAAILMADNTTLAGFAQSDGVTWRNERLANPDTATADPKIVQSGCCAYNTNFVRQGNDVWVAWYSNASNGGSFVQKILPVAGSPIKIPSSFEGTNYTDVDRFPMFTRPDGSAYVAFCQGYINCPIGLYRLSDGATTTIPYSQADYAVDVTAAPDGTIWAVWAKDKGVYAVKSGPGDLTFTTPARLPYPSDLPVYQLSANAANGDKVDIVVNDSTAMWHSQITAAMMTPSASPTPTVTATPTPSNRPTPTTTPTTTPTQTAQPTLPPPPAPQPSLLLTLKPGRTLEDRAAFIKAKVTASGSAVAGAKVARGRISCTTNSRGLCLLKFKPTKPGTLVFNATKSGFVSDTASVKVLADIH